MAPPPSWRIWCLARLLLPSYALTEPYKQCPRIHKYFRLRSKRLSRSSQLHTQTKIINVFRNTNVSFFFLLANMTSPLLILTPKNMPPTCRLTSKFCLQLTPGSLYAAIDKSRETQGCEGVVM